MRKNAERGFTLAELLVATTMISVVMIAVYGAFSSSLRNWRNGERGVATYQDARISLSIMSRELQSMLASAMYLFEGKSDEFEFFEVAPSMHPDLGDAPRTLWVRYHLRPSPEKGRALVREEATVEGAMPLRDPGEDEDKDADSDASVEESAIAREAKSRVKLGKKREFELASGVVSMRVTYLWMPVPDEGSLADMVEGRAEIEPATIIEQKENVKGWGRPQGMRITLTMEDERSANGKTTFTETVVFRGPTAPIPDILAAELGGAR